MPARRDHPEARRPPLLIAHRGDSSRCPENTRAAFAAALACGVDGIELDVRLSADGVPVVCHDATLARFAGGSRPLSRRSLAELGRADVGAWFAPEFSGERLQTLAEVLDQCASVTLCIELKAVGGIGAGAANLRLARRVAAVIRAHRATVRVMVLCFSGAVLERFAALAPQVRVVRNCERLPRDSGAWLDRQPHLHAVCCDRRVLDDGLVDACHARGLRVFTYTCNDTPTLRRLLRLRVDALLTDRPAWLAERLGRRLGAKRRR